jgi:FkbM family methyltransferase
MLGVIIRNLPRNKPELWRQFPKPFLRHILALRHREVIAEIGNNLRMRLDLRDLIARSIYLYGTYDFAVTDAISSLLKPGDCFVDVGANIGTYSLIASRIVGPQGRVVAFEPAPRNLERLKDNISLNGLTNVSLSEKAISDSCGAVDLYEVNNPQNSGQSSLEMRTGATKVSVFSTTLDKELGTSRVDVVKLDAEGYEDRTILGGTALFSRPNAPAVICEGHIADRPAELLRGFGYSVASLPKRRYFPASFVAKKHFS